MPKRNYAHISFLLDRSGSMESIADDTVGGYNAFIAQQRVAGEGRVTASLAQFDSESYDVLYHMLGIQAVPELTRATFRPRGSTPLVDSIARLIDATGASLAAMPEAERPSQVFVVILTDGHENASRHTVMNRSELRQPITESGYWVANNWVSNTLPAAHDTRRVVSEMIQHQREKYGWQFVFLGANQDAISVGGSLGIGMGSSLTYAANSVGVRACYAVAAAGISRSRATGQSLCFSQAERDAAVGVGTGADLWDNLTSTTTDTTNVTVGSTTDQP